MDDTSISLLDRVRHSSDSESWDRLAAIYTPVLQGWLRRYGLQQSDLEDLTQDVLIVVARETPHFEHTGRPGAFRSWLRKVVVNRLRDFWRSQKKIPQATGETDFLKQVDALEDPESELSRIWDREHDDHVLRQALAQSRSKFTPNTWLAMERLVFDGAAPVEVAKELDMTVNAVLIAKSRALSHLRQVMKGLVD